ncbi:hypothetical protein, partial [Acinetobacter calcoaceticus]|uniref:hypothetical protein n=1 Tax=Acinetobacter calcoaceticus TaxID=471 RepID=UPI001D0DD645
TLKVPTVEGIHLLYLEINKIFSLSCQPICNSAHTFGASQACTQGTAGLISQSQLPEIFRYDPFLAVTGAALPRNVGKTTVNRCCHPTN